MPQEGNRGSLGFPGSYPKIRNRQLAPENLLEQSGCRALVPEGDRTHASAPASHFGGPDHRLGLPVTALGEHLRAGGKYQRERRVLVEPRHEMDGFKRRYHRHAVGERVERALLAFAETLRRRVAVDCDEKRRPQGARFGEIADVPAMQDVEHAVGEDERSCKGSEPRRKLLRRANLPLERDLHLAYFDRTTRRL